VLCTAWRLWAEADMGDVFVACLLVAVAIYCLV